MITWNRGEFKQLSAHFTSTEFTCQCGHCGPQLVSEDLIQKLELVRSAFPEGVQINSGYRCPRHQAELLGSGNYETVKNSQHVLGKAADIRPIKLGVMHQFEAECAKHFKAIGIAATWLHVDLRDDKTRRWSYK